MGVLKNRLIVLIGILIFISGFGLAQDAPLEGISPEKIERKAYEKYIGKSNKRDYRFTGDTVIEENETIDGNVIVIEGNLTVKGRIDGNILVILGTVKIEDSASVNGDVASVDGRIYQAEKSHISGNQIETRVKNLFPREEWNIDFDDDEKKSTLSRYNLPYEGSYSTLPLGKSEQTFLLRYNRVQGLFAGWAIPKKIGGKYKIFSVHGFGGYGLEEKRFRYQLGIDRWFFSQRDFRFEIGGKIYDLTDTRDEWRITPLENSLAAFFLKKDFMDFYRRHGYELHVSQNISIFLKGTLAFRDDRYESLERKTNWALFEGEKKFRDNPAIHEGNMRSLYGEIYFDSRNSRENPRRGWYGKFSGETSHSGLNSDFSFNQYILELRRYQKLGRYERLDVRFLLGSAEGDLPFQKGFELGGLSTLRGFPFKKFSAPVDPEGPIQPGYDRMLLGNIEYNINPRLFSSYMPFFNEMHYILFFDFGNAWYNAQVSEKANFYNGFSHLQWHDLKSNFGIALSNSDGTSRLNIARRLDTGINPVVVTFRLSKPF